ncbi:MAG TPA: hypothetical protein VGX92_02010 [Pyrinomonadaceae bacterium]|nr:hypothetical protein [Pyrinomonadaceae bacterium]
MNGAGATPARCRRKLLHSPCGRPGRKVKRRGQQQQQQHLITFLLLLLLLPAPLRSS